MRKDGAARLFWVGMGLLGLFLFPASRAELAEDTLSAYSYKAPDGRFFERFFDVSTPYIMRNTLVVCSDAPDFYLPRLRRFVEYVFSDRNYVILDGREVDPGVISADSVSMIYFGFLPQKRPIRNSCLKKFPEFERFVEKNRRNAKRTITLPEGYLVPYPNALTLPVYCGGGAFEYNEITKELKFSIAARFVEKNGYCFKDNFLDLFDLDSSVQCVPRKSCPQLWNYVETGLLEMKEK